MNSRVLHIHIDRMMVEGLPMHKQQRFVRALETQLSKLASDGLSDALMGVGTRHISSLDAGRLRAGATPEQAAAQVTAALRGGLAGKGGDRHG